MQSQEIGLIDISEKQNEVVSDNEVITNESSFRYGSQRHEQTYDQPRTISDLDKYKTKDFFKRIDQQIDTNDLYQNATKLKELYKLMKDRGIPENHMSKRATQKFRDLELYLSN